jgi:hypothetical protein
LADGGIEEGGLVHVEDVASIEDDEGWVGAAEGHLLEVFLAGDAALSTADQERGTAGGEKVLPVIAAEMVLRGDRFARLEGSVCPATHGMAR